MSKECPVCEQPASSTAKIEMGDTWRDIFGRPPRSLFSSYVMIHAAGVGDSGSIVVYCHTETDVQK